MNNRIRELARQAELNVTLLFNEEKLEKFAELIVRECADYAFSNDQDHKAMLKHFGVEE